MPNTNYEPDAVADAVLTVLRAEGRATPYLIREECEYDRKQINAALRDLVAAGWASKRTRGVYDFEADPREAPASGHPERDDAEPGADDTLPDALAAAIDAYEPGADVSRQTARTALRDAVTWLRAHEGAAKKAAIVAGAKPADVSEQQWWARAARPGLAALAAEGLVERPTTKTYAIETGE